MSIATLKKKTQVQYNNLSVRMPQFSINGTRRNQGYIGQTSLSRSLPRTPMNGAFPRGNGGCCGSFPIKPIVQSAVTSVENPSVIKVSVTGTKGMLENKLKCTYGLNIPKFNKKLPTSTAFTNIVKPNNNYSINDQSSYITRVAKNAIQQSNSCTSTNQVKNQSTCGNKDSYFNDISQKICNLTKPESDYIPISQGERLLQLNNQCIKEDIINNVNTSIKKSPIKVC